MSRWLWVNTLFILIKTSTTQQKSETIKFYKGCILMDLKFVMYPHADEFTIPIKLSLSLPKKYKSYTLNWILYSLWHSRICLSFSHDFLLYIVCFFSISFQGPHGAVDKPFLWAEGRVSLKAALNKSVYRHGEQVSATVDVHNESRKIVRKIRVNWFYKLSSKTSKLNVCTRGNKQEGGWCKENSKEIK